jgi:hypothetical protein
LTTASSSISRTSAIFNNIYVAVKTTYCIQRPHTSSSESELRNFRFSHFLYRFQSPNICVPPPSHGKKRGHHYLNYVASFNEKNNP